MFTVSSDMAVTLTRGDTATLEIVFKGDVPEAEDTVIAALKRAPGRREVLFEKTLIREETGNYLLVIDSADTEGLAFGQYAWDLRIIYADGQVTTPFAAAPFNLTEVVTDLPAEPEEEDDAP